MGRLTQGHYDDVFLNKIKQVCVHVLDQLNQANEIDQAFDLCPSISRRNRVILSFLRDADRVSVNANNPAQTSSASSSTAPPHPNPRPHPNNSIRTSREPSLGTDSVTSLSARRRRRAREMQYVRDPNDSNDDSDLHATAGPSSSAAHLDPSSARNLSMSQPDYTFEQFVNHLDPTDKLLKRSFEIIIKETARQTLANRRDPNHDPSTSSATSSIDPAASLRSAIAASSLLNRPTTFDPYHDLATLPRRTMQTINMDMRSRNSNDTTAALDHTYQLLRSLPPSDSFPNISSQPRSSFSASLNAPASPLRHIQRHSLREFLNATGGLLGSTQDLLASSPDPVLLASPATLPSRGVETSSISPDSLVPQLVQRRLTTRPSSNAISSPSIASRLAEASRRNAEAARTIGEAERLRSSQFIRTSIESLRASLFQLHMDLACTQLQQAHRYSVTAQHDRTASPSPEIGSSYALVMDTIELFDDTLRRLSCLVSNTSRESLSNQPGASTQQNADSSPMRTSLWRVRNLLLLSSMTPRPNQREEEQQDAGTSAASRGAELRAHRHLLATMEESHWSRPNTHPPCSESIRSWRRKLAAWYHLDRDRGRYPDPPRTSEDRQEAYARWHPDLELPYALDDEIMASMATDAASTERPDPIVDTHAAWAYARRHDTSLSDDLNQDAQVQAALEAEAVASALQRLLNLRQASAETAVEVPQQGAMADQGHTRDADTGPAEADPDVSLTRTTSLSRRNAVRGQPLTHSNASSIRSAQSSLSLRRAREHLSLSSPTALPAIVARDNNDAIDEDVVETSIEIGIAPLPSSAQSTEQSSADASESSLFPPTSRPRSGRSGSFTFITTPAEVLRSRQRSQSRSQGEPRSQLSVAAPVEEDDAIDEADSEAEEYIDLDLDLGMAREDAFDFDLVDFIQSELRRNSLRNEDDDADSDSADASPPRRLRRNRDRANARAGRSEASRSASPTGTRVFVSGSGASTPAEARQATFEAYAQRSRLLERRRRMEQQRQGQNEDAEAEGGGGNGSLETSPERRRRRRGRNIGDSSASAGDSSYQRNSLPFPRASER